MWQAFYHAVFHVTPSENYPEGFADPSFTHKETRTGRAAITSPSYH